MDLDKPIRRIWIFVTLPIAITVILLTIGALVLPEGVSMFKPARIGMTLLTVLVAMIPFCLIEAWAQLPKALPADMPRVCTRYNRINWYVSLAAMFGLGLFLGACFTTKALVVKLVAFALMAPGGFTKMALLSRIEHLRSLSSPEPLPVAEPFAPAGRLPAGRTEG